MTFGVAVFYFFICWVCVYAWSQGYNIAGDIWQHTTLDGVSLRLPISRIERPTNYQMTDWPSKLEWMHDQHGVTMLIYLFESCINLVVVKNTSQKPLKKKKKKHLRSKAQLLVFTKSTWTLRATLITLIQIFALWNLDRCTFFFNNMLFI